MASSDQILQAIIDCQPNYNKTPTTDDGEEDGPNFHFELLSVLHQIRIELRNNNHLLATINQIDVT